MLGCRVEVSKIMGSFNPELWVQWFGFSVEVFGLGLKVYF